MVLPAECALPRQCDERNGDAAAVRRQHLDDPALRAEGPGGPRQLARLRAAADRLHRAAGHLLGGRVHRHLRTAAPALPEQPPERRRYRAVQPALAAAQHAL
ncbi:hypothetical protein G6F40_016628 [Rhizopus arrhizus]|nr:hypothetical protein G6F40_016628 [Rhizopus arrhizus]